MDDDGDLTPKEKDELLEHAREMKRERRLRSEQNFIRGLWTLALILGFIMTAFGCVKER